LSSKHSFLYITGGKLFLLLSLGSEVPKRQTTAECYLEKKHTHI
jgi:hypothetical protein